MNVHELIEALKGFDPEMPVVAIGGDNDPFTHEGYYSVGAVEGTAHEHKDGTQSNYVVLCQQMWPEEYT